MNLERMRDYLKRDGWLLGALLGCIALCLLLGMTRNEEASGWEARLRQVLSSMEGAGAVDVAVYYDEGMPCGALVVAEGAGSVAVQLRLSSAVTTLLGLENDRVAVYPAGRTPKTE